MRKRWGIYVFANADGGTIQVGDMVEGGFSSRAAAEQYLHKEYASDPNWAGYAFVVKQQQG